MSWPAQAHGSSMEPGVAELLQEVELVRAAWERVRPELDRRLADRSNPLDFLRTDELGRYPAWDARCGREPRSGDLFLRLLLYEFGVLEGSDTRASRARCEVGTHRIANARRRLDVLVEFGGCELAIENKPDAGWQDEQVADYLAHLEGGWRTCLLVLRVGGDHLPDEQLSREERARTAERGRLIDTSWSALLPWLRRCAAEAEAEAERARHFLVELARHVEARFTNAGDATMTRTLTDELMTAPRLLAAALDVLAARDPILEEIGQRFEHPVRRRWESSGQGRKVSTVRPKGKLKLRARESGLDLEFSTVTDVCFRVQFDGTSYGGFHWGLDLFGRTMTRARRQRLRNAFRANLPYEAEYNHEIWVWWQWLEDVDTGLLLEKPPDVWRAMADPKEVLAKAVVLQAETVERLLEGS